MEKLNILLKEKKYHELRSAIEIYNEVDIAAFLDTLDDDEEVLRVFRMLPKELAVEVFANLESEWQQHIVESITNRELNAIIEDMFLDDAVDFIEEMPANVVKKVLANAKEDTRTLINQFLQYPENSAGSMMTIEFVDLKRTMTVGEAFSHIRKTGVDKETIYTCYVIDGSRRLEGIVSVRSLLLAAPGELVEEIMDVNVTYVQTTDDQEEIANLFRKYGWMSLPVVDTERRLVGIITIDDAVEVLEEEATEDFEKMAAMLPSEKPYLKTSVMNLAKNRIVWLLVLMLSATVTGSILAGFEEAFAILPILVTFIPMLTDTGGNSGAQSSTLVIRGMALQEIEAKDFLKVLWKELRVGIVCGGALSFVNFLRLVFLTEANNMVALTVSLSLYITVVIAKSVGCLLPIAAKQLKLDPAIMASPIITTIVDAFSLIIYLNIAKSLLHI